MIFNSWQFGRYALAVMGMSILPSACATATNSAAIDAPVIQDTDESKTVADGNVDECESSGDENGRDCYSELGQEIGKLIYYGGSTQFHKRGDFIAPPPKSPEHNVESYVTVAFKIQFEKNADNENGEIGTCQKLIIDPLYVSSRSVAADPINADFSNGPEQKGPPKALNARDVKELTKENTKKKVFSFNLPCGDYRIPEGTKSKDPGHDDAHLKTGSYFVGLATRAMTKRFFSKAKYPKGIPAPVPADVVNGQMSLRVYVSEEQESSDRTQTDRWCRSFQPLDIAGVAEDTKEPDTSLITGVFKKNNLRRASDVFDWPWSENYKILSCIDPY